MSSRAILLLLFPIALHGGKLPLWFEESAGGFELRGGPRLKLTARGIETASVRIAFSGARKGAILRGESPRLGRSHYLIGNDPAQWRENLRHYGRLRHRDVYGGIDLIYYPNAGELEFDFEVAPYADPRLIRLAFNSDIQLDNDGSLRTADFRLKPPTVYQDVRGVRRHVDGRWTARGRSAAFTLGPYDRGHRLVIDPVLSWSTLFGGTGVDRPSAMGLDAAGNVIIAGITTSTDFGAVDAPATFHSDIFVMKLNPAGSEVLYYTRLGGTPVDEARALAVGADGSAFVAGYADTPYGEQAGFPIRNPAYADHRGASDAFVLRLSPSGQIVYATFLGLDDTDSAEAIAVDNQGAAYVAVASNHFFSSATDAHVVKLDPSGDRVAFNFKFGGEGPDVALSIALARDGTIWAGGYTRSEDFPVLNAERRRVSSFVGAGFLVQLNATGTELLYSEAGLDTGRNLVSDPAGNVYFLSLRELRHRPLLIKSSDAGSTWEGHDFLPGPEPFGELRFSPASPSHLYAIAGSHLLKSTDGARSWQSIYAVGFFFDSPAYALHPRDPQTIYVTAGFDDSLHKTSDGGATWELAWGADIGVAIAIDPSSPDTVFFCGCHFVDGCEIYRSLDNGNTWSSVYPGYASVLKSAGGVTYAVESVVRGRSRLLRTTDRGDSWQTILSDVLGISARESIVYAWNSTALLRSADRGLSWTEVARGQFRELIFDPVSPATIYAISDDRLLRSSDGGSTWSTLQENGPVSIAVDPVSPSTIYAAFPYRVSYDPKPELRRLGVSEPPRQLPINAWLADFARSARIDAAGNLYVTRPAGAPAGSLVDPIYRALAGGSDAYIVKIDRAGNVAFSTYIGGISDDIVSDLAVDPSGAIYLTGWTFSQNFPLVNAIQGRHRGNAEGFLLRIAPR